MSQNEHVRDTRIEGFIVVDGLRFELGRISSVEDCGIINAGLSVNPVPCIALNDAAWALPEHIRKAIIGHELGHYLLGHRGDRIHGRSMSNEIEADTFAVRFAGLAAVRQLLTTVRKSCLRIGLSPEEADIRLQALPELPKPPPCAPCRKRRRKNTSRSRRRRRKK